MQPLSLLGPLDALGPFVEYIVLVLVLVNLGTRWLAHRRYVTQADEADGAKNVDRSLLHETTNMALVLGAFYMATVHYHAGVVMSTLVVGLVLTDFFEFEARQVEARNDMTFERPKGAVAASLLALLYAGYQSLFVFIEPVWNAIV